MWNDGKPGKLNAPCVNWNNKEYAFNIIGSEKRADNKEITAHKAEIKGCFDRIVATIANAIPTDKPTSGDMIQPNKKMGPDNRLKASIYLEFFILMMKQAKANTVENLKKE